MRYYRYVPWSELRRMYRRRRWFREEAKQAAVVMMIMMFVIRVFLMDIYRRLMITRHEETELTVPFEIRSDPRRRQDEPKLLETVMDRFWWVTLGYVGTVLIKAIVMLG